MGGIFPIDAQGPDSVKHGLDLHQIVTNDVRRFRQMITVSRVNLTKHSREREYSTHARNDANRRVTEPLLRFNELWSVMDDVVKNA